MPIILSQERTVGIEVTMEQPEHTKSEKFWLDVTCRKEDEAYQKHLETSPRLPILGTVPDHWICGEVIPIGEYEIQHQAFIGIHEGTGGDIWQNIIPENQTKNTRRKVIIPSTKQAIMKTGIELIGEERQRQMSVEGWTQEHDSSHWCDEMAKAAALYAIPEYKRNDEIKAYLWPWERKWWKPTPKDRIKELVKAGALVAAEIDRLQNSEK